MHDLVRKPVPTFRDHALEFILPCADFGEHLRRLLTGHADAGRDLRQVGAQERIGQLLVAGSLDLEARTLTAEGKTLSVSIPENAREAFLSGNWDGTSMLLERWEDVEAVAGRLPYVAGF